MNYYFYAEFRYISLNLGLYQNLIPIISIFLIIFYLIIINFCYFIFFIFS